MTKATSKYGGSDKFSDTDGCVRPVADAAVDGLHVADMNPQVETLPEDRNTSSTMTSLGPMYLVVLVVVGFVLTISTATQQKMADRGRLIEVFNIYTCVASILFLLCIQLIFIIARSEARVRRRQQKIYVVSVNHIHGKTNNLAERMEDPEIETQVPEKYKNKRERPKGSPKSSSTTTIYFTHDGLGVNIFLRLAFIGMATVALIQTGFHGFEYVINGLGLMTCKGRLHIIIIAMQVLFIVLQTFFIFKHHKIVFHRLRTSMTFGFVHLIATNICLALVVTIGETRRDFIDQYDSAMRNAGNETMFEADRSADIDTDHCESVNNFTRQTDPYLYSCTVDYCILAAAILCRIFSQTELVTKATSARNNHNNESSDSNRQPLKSSDWRASSQYLPTGSSRLLPSFEPTSDTKIDCHKATRGIFLGLLVFALTVVTITCYLIADRSHHRLSSQTTMTENAATVADIPDTEYKEPNGKDEDYESESEDDADDEANRFSSPSQTSSLLDAVIGDLPVDMFLGAKLVLLVIISIGVFRAFADFRRLRFSSDLSVFDEKSRDGSESRDRNQWCVDRSLLIVAACGVLTVECFVLLAAASQPYFTTLGIITVVSSVFHVIQAGTQLLFILDATHRYVDSLHHVTSKPGRSAVTFLVASNISLIIVSILGVLQAESQTVLMEFYGRLTWCIIAHLSAPLVSLFGLQSAVCLSQIWNNAYRLKQN